MKYNIAFISSLLYFIFSIVYLYVNGYHEDAYILFNYSENLAKTGVISYYPDGPPAEGATDFLWMIINSVFYWFYIPTFISVSILNSLGSFIISYVFVSFLRPRYCKNSLLFCSISWLVSLGVISSFSGFSTVFYNSVLILSLYFLYYRKTLVPYMLLILSLIRPDGVLLSFGIFLITLFWRPFNSQFYKNYFYGYLISGLIGITYFLWRFNYFGESLPLPLYVKSNSSEMIFPGLKSNLDFLKNNYYLFMLLLFVVIKSKKEHLKKYIPILAPGIILFFSLLFAHQSQNIGFRFQYPLWISTILFLLLVITENPTIKRNKYFILILCFGLILQSFKFYRNITISNHHYIDDFSINFLKNYDKLGNDLKVSLTEAGRFTYWTSPIKPVVKDLIGLNTKEFAKSSITESYLKSIDSDIIFIHHAGVINPKIDVETKVFKVESQNEINANIQNPSTREEEVSFNTIKYLENEFNSYNIYLVDYSQDDTFYHLYALKKKAELDSIFIKSLLPSFGGKRTYFENLTIREKYKVQ